jgi:ligand-binding sensor domain-containing protein
MKTMGSHGYSCALIFSFLFLLSCNAQDKQAPKAGEQISPFVRRIAQDQNGAFWFGTNGDGVCRYDGKSLDYFTVENGFGGRAVRAIVEDKKGSLWFGTSGGVTRYEGGAFTNFTEEDGLSSNDVWSLCIDRAGSIWVGTLGGVFRYDGKSFNHFKDPGVKK